MPLKSIGRNTYPGGRANTIHPKTSKTVEKLFALMGLTHYTCFIHDEIGRCASLMGSVLIKTNLEQANLLGCRIYGISAWDVRLEGAIQHNLVITLDNQPTITVDNLEVAQFIYLLRQGLQDGKFAHQLCFRDAAAFALSIRREMFSTKHQPLIFTVFIGII